MNVGSFYNRLDPRDPYDRAILIGEYTPVLKQKKHIPISIMQQLKTIIYIYSYQPVLEDDEVDFIHAFIQYAEPVDNSEILLAMATHPSKDEFSEDAIRHGAKPNGRVFYDIARYRDYLSIRKFQKLFGPRSLKLFSVYHYITNMKLSVDQLTTLIIENINLGGSLVSLEALEDYDPPKVYRLLVLFPNIKITGTGDSISINWDEYEGDTIEFDMIDEDALTEFIKNSSDGLFVKSLQKRFPTLLDLSLNSILYSQIDISAVPPVIKESGVDEIIKLRDLADQNGRAEFKRLLTRPE